MKNTSKKTFAIVALVVGSMTANTALAEKPKGALEQLDAYSQEMIQAYEKKDLKNAVLIAEKAQALSAKTLGKDSEKYIKITGDLAYLYSENNQTEKAEKTFKDLIDKKNNAVTNIGNTKQIVMMNYVEFLEKNKRLDEANDLREKIIEGIPKDNFGAASMINNFAQALINQGEYERAEKLTQESLNILKNVAGEKDPVYATTLQNLGNLYEKMGKKEEAKIALDKSSEILKEIIK